MSIQTGQIMTAVDMQNLKAKILTLYTNRKVNVGWTYPLNSGSNYYKQHANGTGPQQSDSIVWNFGNLIDACLVINDIPNLKEQQDEAGGKIFEDGTSTDLLNWVDNIKDATTTSTNHGCRGACVGLCSGSCAGTCKDGCNGCSNGCTATCTNGCKGSSSNSDCGSCTASCGQGCATGCGSNSCKSGCQTTTCKSGCYGECSDGCYSNCTSGCYNGCYGGNEYVVADPY